MESNPNPSTPPAAPTPPQNPESGATPPVPPTPPTPEAPKPEGTKSGSKAIVIILVILGFLLFGGGGYYAGRMTAPTPSPTAIPSPVQQNNQEPSMMKQQGQPDVPQPSEMPMRPKDASGAGQPNSMMPGQAGPGQNQGTPQTTPPAQ